ncbi:MAG: hypothetical protein AAGG11_11670 [Pseudomonadota bacterium]
MARTRQYTRDEVLQLLIDSEQRNSPVSGQPGHGLSKHVEVSGYQISDRLVGTFGGDAASFPIIVGPGGAVASAADHRTIWKEAHAHDGKPQLSTKAAKRAQKERFGSPVSRSGAFMDRQYAVVVARFMLNSTEGQAQLLALDNGEARVPLEMSLNRLDMIDVDAWKMYYADKSDTQAGSDITHIETFSRAFMLIDALPGNGIHLQTFYPIA